MANIDLKINEEGNLFYLKWRKDTIQGFMIAPIFLAFYSVCFAMIVGITIKLSFIIVFPAPITVIAFIYTPLFVRKKYLNNILKSITIKEDIISFETYKWFQFDPIFQSFLLNDIKINKSSDIRIFKGKTVHSLVGNDANNTIYYIIDDFFDNLPYVLQT